MGRRSAKPQALWDFGSAAPICCSFLVKLNKKVQFARRSGERGAKEEEEQEEEQKEVQEEGSRTEWLALLPRTSGTIDKQNKQLLEKGQNNNSGRV